MGRGGRRRYRPKPPEPVPTGIGGLQLTGIDSLCGCPGCHGGAMTVLEKQLPPKFVGLYTQEEWTKLAKSVDDLFDRTVWPVFPCIFTHFCIPFSPVCAFCLCAKRRSDGQAVLVAAENARLAREGLEWVATPNRVGGFLTLRWIPGVREGWEAAHPESRQVSREPQPPEFFSPELQQQMALGIVYAMQQQQQMFVPNGAGGVAMVPFQPQQQPYGAQGAAPVGPPPAYGQVAPAMYAAPVYGQQQSQQQQFQPGPLQQTMQVEGSQQQQQQQQPSAPAAVSADAAFPASPSAMHVVGGSYVQVAAVPMTNFSPVEARFCSSCGAARADPNGRFCASCGVPTAAAAGAAPSTTTMS